MTRQGRGMHRLQHVVPLLQQNTVRRVQQVKRREAARPTLSMAAPFFCAYAPHSRNTRPCRLALSHLTTASVKVSQPRSLWELARCARTVNTALSNSTPEARGRVEAGEEGATSALWCSFGSTLDTLSGPRRQVPVTRVLKAFDVRRQLFEHVPQTTWKRIPGVMNI